MVLWTLSPFNLLSEMKILLDGISQNYVGKTTVVSAVDVTATKYTERPVKGLDVNGVNTRPMISLEDG